MRAKIECVYTELLPIDSVIPNRRNRNFHPKDQIIRLAKLIEVHGFRHPIVISKLSNEVVAGHGRLEAAKLIGMDQVPVDYQEFQSLDEEYQFLISDNAISDWSDLNFVDINLDIQDLGPFDVELLGLKSFEVEPADKKPKKEKLCPHCKEKL